MIPVDDTRQNVFFVMFAVIWIGGEFALFIRTYLKQRLYLRHFADQYPYFAGEPLFDTPRTWSAFRSGMRLMRGRQADPALERLRREVWRRNRQMIYWIFGFPLLVIGIMALLIATGVVRYLA